MAESRRRYSCQDVSLSTSAGRPKDGEGHDLTSTKSSKSFKITVSSDGQTQGSGRSRKGLNMEWVARLTGYAEGLMARMYKLNKILDYPDSVGHVFSEAFWKAGVFPNYPKICTLLSKKFPEHFVKLQLERIDKAALDALNDSAEFHLQNLEPWIKLLQDFMTFREQALRIILDISSTVITLLPSQNSIILHGFMDLFCCFVRVNLFSEKMPWKMILQVYNLLYSITNNEQDCGSYHRLLHFIDSHAPPLKVLQEELSVVSSRIGEVLEALGPVILLSADTKKLRNEGFLSPYHPRYPHILTNSAHPKRAQDLVNVTSYREWVLLGFLVCPDELLHFTTIDIASVVLKEHLVLLLFRDEYISLHEEYQLHVLPRVSESKKLAKSGRGKQKEADLEYSIAKQVKKMISEVHEQALLSCDAIHRERRMLLKQEIGRMVLFFTDQPSLLAPNIQMVFSALALAQSEILWYFQHVGIASSRSKVAQMVPLNIDPNDPTIGFILDGMDRLCNLVRKYKTAIRGYALSYLSSSASRIEYLLDTPGIIALDLDESLKALFQRIIQHLENVPKPRFENISAIKCDLSDFRKDWLSVLITITSSRSPINIRHLEKAAVPAKKEGILPEGNAAYDWSRYVDELEYQLSKHSSLKQLYFYHQYLTTVFRNTMFGPEGRPQHCCAWLGVASSFIECASPTVPEEVNRIGKDAILYVESLTEAIMGGLEGLINILDSEEGFGALDSQLLPEQAAYRLNCESRGPIPPGKNPKPVDDGPLPGYESILETHNSVKMLEAAMHRLTNLCSVVNEIEPICVLNHVFVLREYLRECIIENFRKRLLTLLKTENDLQRPSVLESLIRRQIRIVNLAEQHSSIDLIQGIREVLLSEAYSGPVSLLQLSENPPDQHTGAAMQVVCDWYIDNILKDISGAGIIFAPVHKSFKSTRPVGGYFAESFTDPRELQALVRLFGGYGVDRLDKMMKEHTTVLLNCIYTSLCSNREVLKAVANSIHCGNLTERDACLRQIVGIDTVVEFCIQAGQALVFHELLAEAARNMLEGSVPLIYSLLDGMIKHLPDEIPEKKEIRRMKSVANSICVAHDHDSEWVRSLFEEIGGAYDGVWSLLPYLLATFMTSTIWKATTFNINIGGFSNNFHCLARCISAVIAASEFMRLEYDGHVAETMDMETPPNVSAQSSIKAAIQLFIKCAAGILLDSRNDTNRSHLAAKLIFLDQLCETSPYLPRSTLEAHVPYTIIRSIYNQYYGNSGSTVALPSPLPHDSTAISLTRTSSVIQLGNTNSHHSPDDSGSFRGSISHDQNLLNDTDGGKHKNLRRYGPLRYSLSRKSKHVKGSTSSSSFSQLPKFAVSRLGSVSYK